VFREEGETGEHRIFRTRWPLREKKYIATLEEKKKDYLKLPAS